MVGLKYFGLAAAIGEHESELGGPGRKRAIFPVSVHFNALIYYSASFQNFQGGRGSGVLQGVATPIRPLAHLWRGGSADEAGTRLLAPPTKATKKLRKDESSVRESRGVRPARGVFLGV